MHEQSPSVKLLTILNVQSAKPPPSTKKRSSSSSSSSTTTTTNDKVKGKKEVVTRDWHGIAKRAKTAGGKGNKKLKLDTIQPQKEEEKEQSPLEKAEEEEQPVEEQEEEEEDKEDSFKFHFGSNTPLVNQVEKDEAESVEWDKKKKLLVKGLGEFQVFIPKDRIDGEKEKKTPSGLDLVSFQHCFSHKLLFVSLYSLLTNDRAHVMLCSTQLNY